MVILSCVFLALTAVCEPTSDGVRLVSDGKAVWQLHLDESDGKPYVHPLCLPSGTCLTEVRPADHVWHKGLWFSWKYVNGANFWETPDRCGNDRPGVTRVVSRDIRIDGAAAVVNLTLAYDDGSDVALEESRMLSFSAPDGDGAYAVVSEHEFRARRDVTLDRTPPYVKPTGIKAGGYAGLALRLSSVAARALRLEHPSDRVAIFRAADTRETVTVEALTVPPSSRFYAWPDLRLSNFSPVYDRPLTLKAGERLRLAYRIRLAREKSPPVVL